MEESDKESWDDQLIVDEVTEDDEKPSIQSIFAVLDSDDDSNTILTKQDGSCHNKSKRTKIPSPKSEKIIEQSDLNHKDCAAFYDFLSGKLPFTLVTEDLDKESKILSNESNCGEACAQSNEYNMSSSSSSKSNPVKSTDEKAKLISHPEVSSAMDASSELEYMKCKIDILYARIHELHSRTKSHHMENEAVSSRKSEQSSISTSEQTNKTEEQMSKNLQIGDKNTRASPFSGYLTNESKIGGIKEPTHIDSKYTTNKVIDCIPDGMQMNSGLDFSTERSPERSSVQYDAFEATKDETTSTTSSNKARWPSITFKKRTQKTTVNVDVEQVKMLPFTITAINYPSETSQDAGKDISYTVESPIITIATERKGKVRRKLGQAWNLDSISKSHSDIETKGTQITSVAQYNKQMRSDSSEIPIQFVQESENSVMKNVSWTPNIQNEVVSCGINAGQEAIVASNLQMKQQRSKQNACNSTPPTFMLLNNEQSVYESSLKNHDDSNTALKDSAYVDSTYILSNDEQLKANHCSNWLNPVTSTLPIVSNPANILNWTDLPSNSVIPSSQAMIQHTNAIRVMQKKNGAIGQYETGDQTVGNNASVSVEVSQRGVLNNQLMHSFYPFLGNIQADQFTSSLGQQQGQFALSVPSTSILCSPQQSSQLFSNTGTIQQFYQQPLTFGSNFQVNPTYQNIVSEESGSKMKWKQAVKNAKARQRPIGARIRKKTQAKTLSDIRSCNAWSVISMQLPTFLHQQCDCFASQNI